MVVPVDGGIWLSHFDRERRRDPPSVGNYEIQKTANLTREITPSKSFVLWSQIGELEASGVINDEKSRAESHGRSVVWKIYSHDGAGSLSTALAQAGFQSKPHETLMVFDLTAEIPKRSGSADVQVHQVSDDAQYQDYVTIDRGAFLATPGPVAPPREPRPTDPRVGLFVAYVQGAPASIGRVEYEPGQWLAGLFGGGTLPEFRGHGIYQQLVRVRADWARARGARGLFTEAVDTTSRPILERLGFVPIAGIEPWSWEPPTA